jgi:DNA repair exonuclease SbcCD ATPase subunit
MSNVEQALAERKKELARKQSENDLLNRQIDTMEQRILELVAVLQTAKEALAFLEDLANGRRGAMKGKIESVVTEALRLIYGASYRVELSYAFKNNRSSLEIEMVRDIKAGEVRRDMGGYGGGVADTISVPLRLMVLVGSKKTDKVCVLDECWKHIDVRRIEQVGQFVQMLTEQLGMQVIFLTHHQPLRQFADRTYEVSEIEGKSSVR